MRGGEEAEDEREAAVDAAAAQSASLVVAPDRANDLDDGVDTDHMTLDRFVVR